MDEKEAAIRLVLSDEIRTLMEERMILDEDIQQVLSYVEQSGKRIWNADTGTYTAYYKPGTVTYWVEYSMAEDGYRILNTYSHRLEIEE